MRFSLDVDSGDGDGGLDQCDQFGLLFKNLWDKFFQQKLPK